MPNKYLRLIQEPQFALRMLIIAALASLAVFWWGKTQIQGKEIMGLHEKRLVAMQAPALEAQLRALTEKKNSAPPPEPKAPALVLKGVFLQKNGAVALINDDYYTEGTWLGDFLIVKITASEVKLVNKKTNEYSLLVLSP